MRINLVRVFSLIAVIVSLFSSKVWAQSPTSIRALKIRGYAQSAAGEHVAAESVFQVNVVFSPSVVNRITVQLRAPGGAVTNLDSIGVSATNRTEFQLYRTFPSDVAMNSAFPDGVYELSVIGDNASPKSFTLTRDSLSPFTITNYPELQSWSGPNPAPTWSPVSGVSSTDYTSLDVRLANGEFVQANPEGLSPTAGSVKMSLPLFLRAMTARISYAKTASRSDNGVTVESGTGFSVSFPLFLVPRAPVITRQPQGQIVRAGSNISLTASVAGDELTYAWRRNSAIVGGNPSFIVSRAGATDAGSYVLEVRNYSGTAVSDPAVVAIAPSLNIAPIPAPIVAPLALAVDPSGNVLVSNNASIFRVAATGVMTLIAGGSSSAEVGYVDGRGSGARFWRPMGLAVDPAGTIYVADNTNHVIRKIVGDEVTTFVGSGMQSGSRDGALGIAQFSGPRGIALDSAGNLFVADTGNHTIRKVTPAGSVSTVAGRSGEAGRVDGGASIARFSSPSAVAVDLQGNVYVADSGNAAIRCVTPDGNVTTFAGLLGSGASRDGLASGARFVNPVGIAIDERGNLYVADDNAVRRVSPDGFVATIGGGVESATTGFISMRGLARSPNGDLIVADLAGLKRCSLVAGSSDAAIAVAAEPTSQVVVPGSPAALSVQANGPSLYYQWRKDGISIPGATSTTLSFSGVQSSDAGRYSVVVANALGSFVTREATLLFGGGRIVNLSIRAMAGQGDRTLTVGAVVGGGGNGVGIPVLVRAVGPSLSLFNVPGALSDPSITVVRGTQIIAENDNWGTSPQVGDVFARVGAFPLQPNSRDAAIVATLSPGPVTVQVGALGGSGIALAEFYDLTDVSSSSASAYRLTNISARTTVGTGSDVLLAGFGIGGGGGQKLLIRGVGPSLATFGVAGALADPVLEILSGANVVARNDDWSGDATLGAAFSTVGAFPFAGATAKDAAIIVMLPPGAYTAKISGSGSTTGIALIEIYELPMN